MKLLVSVRNAHEAEIALREGVDIIDLKEPDNGALGQVATLDMQSVANLIGGRLPLSVALGELSEAPRLPFEDSPLLDGVSYAKIGLAYCKSTPHWKDSWINWASQLPAVTTPVAVAYADSRTCDAPSLEEVADLALQTSARVLLIDTHNKRFGNTFAHVSCSKLIPIVRELQRHSVQVALAGSLKQEDLRQISKIAPDIVAVRGVVCEQNNRRSQICPERLSDFQAALAVA